MDNRTYGNKPVPFPPEIAHNPKPKPVASTYRPPLAQSAWSSSQLSTKPFWESSSTISQQQPLPQQQQQQQQQQHTPPSPPNTSSSWGAQTSASSPLPSPQSSTPLSPTSASSMTRKQRRSLGSYASKYATRPPLDINSAAPATTSTGFISSTLTTSSHPGSVLEPAPAAPAPATAPPPPVTESGSEQVVTISLADLLAPLAPPRPPSPPAQKPLFELDIELIPGVTTLLPVYETDNYISLVKSFSNKHQLSITPEAEQMFANKIEQMAMELGKLQSQQ